MTAPGIVDFSVAAAAGAEVACVATKRFDSSEKKRFESCVISSKGIAATYSDETRAGDGSIGGAGGSVSFGFVLGSREVYLLGSVSAVEPRALGVLARPLVVAPWTFVSCEQRLPSTLQAGL